MQCISCLDFHNKNSLLYWQRKSADSFRPICKHNKTETERLNTMGSPTIHAQLSAKRFGGKPEDYLKVHELMDSSKSAMADLRHRTLTHNSWFVTTILERIFGQTIKNSDGKDIAVRDIGQWHVMEDFHGHFPTVQDYLMNMTFQPWMDNGAEVPPSNIGLPPLDKALLDPKPQATKKPDEASLAVSGMEPIEVDSSDDPEFPPKRNCGGGGRLD